MSIRHMNIPLHKSRNFRHHQVEKSLQKESTKLREILKNRGSFYDPKVVDACLRLFNEKDYRL